MIKEKKLRYCNLSSLQKSYSNHLRCQSDAGRLPFVKKVIHEGEFTFS